MNKLKTWVVPWQRRFAWLTLAMLLGITWIALSPRAPGLSFTHADKLQHLLAFVALSVSGALAWVRSPRGLGGLAALLWLYGGLLEVMQAFIPGRESSWADLAANTLGIALGLLAAWAWPWKKNSV